MGVGMSIPFPFLFPLMLVALAHGEDLSKLDEALPLYANISAIYPVFDFDLDSCYPSAAISRTGKQNDGLKPTGLGTGLCHNNKFLNVSNTYHRYACVEGPSVNGSSGNESLTDENFAGWDSAAWGLADGGLDAWNSTAGGINEPIWNSAVKDVSIGNATGINSTIYCGHSFALYMLKDQLVALFGGGHRHDFVHAILWTKNGNITAATYSGLQMTTIGAADIPKTINGHPKFVYHKAGIHEHTLRPAKSHEKAENPYKRFVTPTIASWYTMKGDNLTNEQLRKAFTSFDYGGEEVRLANVDGRFLAVFNLFKPKEYPEFPPTSGDYSQ